MTSQSELEQITNALGGPHLSAWDYLTAVIILVVAIVLGRLMRLALRRIVNRSRTDDLLGDLIGRIVSYIVWIFGLIYSLETLDIAIGPILGALGIVGIALAFAFQDILENFVAGIILQLQRPFASGDEIEVAGHEGAITSVDTRTITIRTPDNETVRIPSAEVIRNAITNHTQFGRRRTTVEVGVAYGTDLDRAGATILAVLGDVEGVHPQPTPEVLVHGFGDSSIDLSVRYWHGPSIAEHWRTRHAVATAVFNAFDEAGITIPFPQRVLHMPQTVNQPTVGPD